MEQRRLATLEAMGIAVYVSRTQLPGAAPTRRVAVRRRPAPAVPPVSAPARRTTALPALNAVAPAASASPAAPTGHSAPLRFSLAAIVCGGWLWLEETESGVMSQEQLQLVGGMARALEVAVGRGGTPRQDGSRIEYFNWPLNNNRQLDHGEEAARWGVAGYIRRRLERDGCRGLVLLGEACAERVPIEQLECKHVVCTLSTAAMLAAPASKQQVWRDLRNHCLAS